MSGPSLFNAVETRTLQFTPLWVFFAIAAADGKVDAKEVDVFVKELSDAHLFKERLARELLMTVRDDFANVWAAFGADSRNVVTGLTQVADLLDRKVPPQVAYNFKAAMLMIGFNVAEATGKGLFGGGQKALAQKHQALDAVAMVMRFAMAAPAARPAPAPAARPATASKPAPPPPPKKHTSIYLVIDSSRRISDIAYLLDGGLRRFPEKLCGRPQRGVGVNVSLILADNTGRVVTPLTEATQFSAPSLLGRGRCCLGQALNLLLSDVSAHPAEGKPLVVVVLAGQPDDEWAGAADKLKGLAQQGKANVFVFGVGGYADAAVLKRLTTMSPLTMAMNDVTTENMQKSFDWLYSITDVILTGLESGASGQRRDVAAPPSCLKALN
jgi:uncharacterized protein YegL